MIQASFERNAQGQLCGFWVEDHGVDYVCAAVSALVINAINSLEAFTGEELLCDAEEEGFIRCEMPKVREGERNHDVDLLLSSLEMGLAAIAEEYPQQMRLLETE